MVIEFEVSGVSSCHVGSRGFSPGLHDFWFAAASETMDSFAQWGAARPRFLEHFGMPSQEVPAPWRKLGGWMENDGKMMENDGKCWKIMENAGMEIDEIALSTPQM